MKSWMAVVGFALGLLAATTPATAGPISTWDSTSPLTFVTETVDSPGSVGEHTSLVFDKTGRPVIAYRDVSNLNLKVAVKTGTGTGESAWTKSTADDGGAATGTGGTKVGIGTSLRIDHFGVPHIAHGDLTNFDLKYVRGDVPGIGFAPAVADSAAQVLSSSTVSLALDRSEQPAITFSTSTVDLGFKRLDPATGAFAATVIVDDGVAAGPLPASSSLGNYSSLAYDIFGNPAVAYLDSTNLDLRFARSSDGGATWTRELVMSTGDVGRGASLAFDPLTGLPAISYFEEAGTLDELHYVTKIPGVGWFDRTVAVLGDNVSALGQELTSLAFNPLTGDPAVAFFSSSGVNSSVTFSADLGFARWNGSDWIVQAVDTAGSVGQYASLTFNDLGQPAIAYFDNTNDNLKFALDPEVVATPEPGTLLLLGSGLAGLATWARRRGRSRI